MKISNAISDNYEKISMLNITNFPQSIEIFLSFVGNISLGSDTYYGTSQWLITTYHDILVDFFMLFILYFDKWILNESMTVNVYSFLYGVNYTEPIVPIASIDIPNKKCTGIICRGVSKEYYNFSISFTY